MRILRLGLMLGLLVTASACANRDDTATSAVPPDPPTTSSTSSTTTRPPVTAVPSTESAATTEPPDTIGPAETTTTVTTTTVTTTTVTTTTVTTTPVTTTPASTAPASTLAPASSPTPVDVRIYLLRGERLAIAHRQVEGPSVLRNTLVELLAGPTDAERTAGLHTEIPDGTMLRAVNLADGLATVDLSRDYERGGGTLSMTARVAQVVFTASQFDNSDEVLFWLEGAPVEFLGGEGIEVGDALRRQDVDWALTRGIIIDTPLPGATVTGPITVTGEGDVYEADFPIEVRRDGERIGDVVIVFAGAQGNWADFRTTISVDAPSGPIELVAVSPVGCTPDSEPGCPVDLETIVPLTLTG